MKVGNFDTDKKILIIAEIGNNHEGDFALAEEMIWRASDAGAGAVKFQSIVPEELTSISQTDRIRQLERFQFTYDQFGQLSEIAKKVNIIFLCTPFAIESVNYLDPLVPAFKIASGDNTFYPLISEIAKTGKPIIISAGIASKDTIMQTRDFVYNIWHKNDLEQSLAILHCVSCYPTIPTDANLSAIRSLEELGVTVGYSDHTIGVEAAVLSVALGARIIEKHFTLDKNYSDFRDHKLSADPDEFAMLVKRVDETIELLGDSETRPECEIVGESQIRRSITARIDLIQGTRLEWSHFSWVRPGIGIPPGNEEKLLGKKLKRPLKRGEMILFKDIG